MLCGDAGLMKFTLHNGLFRYVELGKLTLINVLCGEAGEVYNSQCVMWGMQDWENVSICYARMQGLRSLH